MRLTAAQLLERPFCSDFKAINLTAQYLPFRGACEFEQPLGTDLTTKLRMGNIKARMRMVYLYDPSPKARRAGALHR